MEEYGNQKLSLSAIEYAYYKMLQEVPEFKDYASLISQVTNSFAQAPNNNEFIASQYDIISGENSYLATEANEIMLSITLKLLRLDEDEEVWNFLRKKLKQKFPAK